MDKFIEDHIGTGDDQLPRKLLDALHSGGIPPDRQNEMLYLACERGDFDTAKILTKASANTNYLDPDTGYVPIGRAAQFGHSEIVELLLDWGVSANVRDRRRNTPLHDAASSACPSLFCIDLLVARGARLDAKNRDSMSPLCVAALYGQFAAVRVLLGYGADRWLTDNRKMTALDIAEEQLVHIRATPDFNKDQELMVIETIRLLQGFPIWELHS